MADQDAKTFEVVIDGKTCTAKDGEYLYDVAKRNGIFIPTLCRHDGFEPRAACRICICEVIMHGRSKVVTSCCYPIEAPCEVKTNSDSIVEQRRVILMLLQARSPESDRIRQMGEFYQADLPESFIKLDTEKCILCGLCMQACDALGTGAISTVMRGIEKKVSTPYDKPNDDCVGCHSCANVCPTDAIEWSETETTRTIWGRRFELDFCERCGTSLGTKEEVAWAAKGAGVDDPKLCDACRKKAMADAMLSAYARE
jgi:bidirectional [NiFe] hydrogenase diaphorase subunit